MTLNQLIEELEMLKKRYGGDKIIKVSSDEEGNMISDIFEIVPTINEEDDKNEILVIYPNQ